MGTGRTVHPRVRAVAAAAAVVAILLGAPGGLGAAGPGVGASPAAQNAPAPSADLVTRAETAKLIVEAFDLPLATEAGPSFQDVAPGTWYYVYVETLYHFSIVDGYPDGTFNPSGHVNRAEIAKMIVEAANLTIQTTDGPHFSDVSADQWAYQYVETLYHFSIVDGYPNGTFQPDRNVNSAELAKMLTGAVNPTPRSSPAFIVEFLGPSSHDVLVGEDGVHGLDLAISNHSGGDVEIRNWNVTLSIVHQGPSSAGGGLLDESGGGAAAPNYSLVRLVRLDGGSLGATLLGPTEFDAGGGASDEEQTVTLSGTNVVGAGKTLNAAVVFDLANQPLMIGDEVRCTLTNLALAGNDFVRDINGDALGVESITPATDIAGNILHVAADSSSIHEGAPQPPDPPAPIPAAPVRVRTGAIRMDGAEEASALLGPPASALFAEPVRIRTEAIRMEGAEREIRHVPATGRTEAPAGEVAETGEDTGGATFRPVYQPTRR